MSRAFCEGPSGGLLASAGLEGAVLVTRPRTVYPRALSAPSRALRHIVLGCLVAAGCGSSSLTMDASNTTTGETGARSGVVVASGQQSPVAIAVDGVNVYWMNLGTNATTDPKAPTGWTGGQVLKCAVAGCGGAPVALASISPSGPGAAAPAPLVSDGESVYWSDESSSQIFKCGVAGCGGQPEVIAPQSAQGLAVFQGNFYWTRFSAELYACPVAGCDSSQVVALWSAGNSPCDVGVAVDASGIYWVGQAPDMLLGCPLAGCGGSPTVLMAGSTDVANVRQVALDADNVYFTDGNPQLGMILACAKSGCGATPTVLANKLDAPVAIATDGVNVYWTEEGPDFVAGASVTGAGRVRKCAVGGCGNAPTSIATGLTSPGAIALDDANVYWTEAGPTADGGKILEGPQVTDSRESRPLRTGPRAASSNALIRSRTSRSSSSRRNRPRRWRRMRRPPPVRRRWAGRGPSRFRSRPRPTSADGVQDAACRSRTRCSPSRRARAKREPLARTGRRRRRCSSWRRSTPPRTRTRACRSC